MNLCTVEHIKGEAAYTQHKHNAYQILFVRKGRASVRMYSTEREVSGPAFVFINNLENHSIWTHDAEYERYSVIIDAKALQQKIRNHILLSVFSCFNTTGRYILPVSEKLAARTVPILDILSEATAYPSQEAEAAALLQVLFYQVYRASPEYFRASETKIDKAVWEIRRTIENNPKTDITLSGLAENFFFDKYYLSHSFKKNTGYSIKHYTLLCRLSLARELLQSTALSIADICTESGFGDISNFARFFKREVGMPPTKYRQKSKERPN